MVEYMVDFGVPVIILVWFVGEVEIVVGVSAVFVEWVDVVDVGVVVGVSVVVIE